MSRAGNSVGTLERIRLDSAFPPSRWMLMLLGLVLVSLVGVALLIGGIDRNSPQLTIYGAFMAGLGFGGLFLLPTEFRLLFRRTGAVLGEDPEGRLATVVPRARWYMPYTVYMLSVLTCAPLVSGVAALFDDELRGLALFMLPLGLWLASYFVPIVRGQVHCGGLYFTPEDVTYVKQGFWWRARWEDLVGPTEGEPLFVVLQSGRQAELGRTTRWGWKACVRSPQPGIVGIETRHLALGPTVLAALIARWVTVPEERKMLGTHESVILINLHLTERRQADEAVRGVEAGHARTGEARRPTAPDR